MTGLGLGAAFLMANSSIGPGFLTQTSFYTEQLLTSFGFVILISIILDFGAQINIWRAITLSGMRAQEIANEVFPLALPCVVKPGIAASTSPSCY